MRSRQHLFALRGRRLPSRTPSSARTRSNALLRFTALVSRWMWRVQSYSLPPAQRLLLLGIRFSSMADGRRGSWFRKDPTQTSQLGDCELVARAWRLVGGDLY